MPLMINTRNTLHFQMGCINWRAPRGLQIAPNCLLRPLRSLSLLAVDDKRPLNVNDLSKFTLSYKS